MQLRRGPPEGSALDSPKPTLRLVAAPKGAVRAPKTWWSWRTFDSYSVRAVAGLLLVSIPVSVLLGYVMSNSSASISIDQAKARAAATAEAASVRIIDYVAERRLELRHMARVTVGKLTKSAFQAHLLDAFAYQSSFDGIQIFDPAGKLVASTGPALRLSITPSGLPFANSMAIETMGPIVLHDATLVGS